MQMALEVGLKVVFSIEFKLEEPFSGTRHVNFCGERVILAVWKKVIHSNVQEAFHGAKCLTKCSKTVVIQGLLLHLWELP